MKFLIILFSSPNVVFRSVLGRFSYSNFKSFVVGQSQWVTFLLIPHTSDVPRPEVPGGVKPLVYRQWQLRHATLVKWINTTASIRTKHCRQFHKMSNVLSENLKFRVGIFCIEFCILFFMIRYSKFTDNIGSGNFTDTFCQNTDKFQKSVGVVTPPHLPLGTPLHALRYV